MNSQCVCYGTPSGLQTGTLMHKRKEGPLPLFETRHRSAEDLHQLHFGHDFISLLLVMLSHSKVPDNLYNSTEAPGPAM